MWQPYNPPVDHIEAWENFLGVKPTTDQYIVSGGNTHDRSTREIPDQTGRLTDGRECHTQG